MSTRKSTTARLKAQPEPEILNDAEIEKLSDRLAAVLVVDHTRASENIALMTLLFDHLQKFEKDRLCTRSDVCTKCKLSARKVLSHLYPAEMLRSALWKQKPN